MALTPPRPDPGTPAPPDGIEPPRRGAAVFVDTVTALRKRYAHPLLVCAQQGFLDVFWSPWVAAELARVECRRRVERLRACPDRGALRVAMKEAREAITVAVGEMERWWTTPPAQRIRDASEASDLPTDVDDQPVLAAARAARVRYLLSQDTGSFAHGRRYSGLAPALVPQLSCWDPDSFLTSLFSSDSYVYEVVAEECAAIWGDTGAR